MHTTSKRKRALIIALILAIPLITLSVIVVLSYILIAFSVPIKAILLTVAAVVFLMGLIV